MPCLDLGLQLLDLAVESYEVVKQSLDVHTEGASQLVVGVFDQLRGPRGDTPDAFRSAISASSPGCCWSP
jgi:hypothetical protein